MQILFTIFLFDFNSKLYFTHILHEYYIRINSISNAAIAATSQTTNRCDIYAFALIEIGEKPPMNKKKKKKLINWIKYMINLWIGLISIGFDVWYTYNTRIMTTTTTTTRSAELMLKARGNQAVRRRRKRRNNYFTINDKYEWRFM